MPATAMFSASANVMVPRAAIMILFGSEDSMEGAAPLAGMAVGRTPGRRAADDYPLCRAVGNSYRCRPVCYFLPPFHTLTMLRPIVLIPARMASTRLPGKPLADIGGMPMIVHVMHR